MFSIIKPYRRYLWVLFLWLIFSIGCFVAPFIVMFYPFLKHYNYMKHFIMSVDRMCAAMLGFSGRVTLSTECIHAMRWMKNILNEIENNHCEESAFTEGAYCRIKDKKLGIK